MLSVRGATRLGAAVVCFVAAGQADRSGTYNWLGVCVALVAVFLVFNKVCSLQYALWLLPFFVLLNVRVRWWLAYVAVDLLAYNAVWSWVDGWRSHGASPSPTAWMGCAIVARSVLLLVLIPLFLRPEPVWRTSGDAAMVTSHEDAAAPRALAVT